MTGSRKDRSRIAKVLVTFEMHVDIDAWSGANPDVEAAAKPVRDDVKAYVEGAMHGLPAVSSGLITGMTLRNQVT